MLRDTLVAASLLLASSPAFAACSIDIDGNDSMQFDVKRIKVPKACLTASVSASSRPMAIQLLLLVPGPLVAHEGQPRT